MEKNSGWDFISSEEIPKAKELRKFSREALSAIGKAAKAIRKARKNGTQKSSIDAIEKTKYAEAQAQLAVEAAKNYLTYLSKKSLRLSGGSTELKSKTAEAAFTVQLATVPSLQDTTSIFNLLQSADNLYRRKFTEVESRGGSHIPLYFSALRSVEVCEYLILQIRAWATVENTYNRTVSLFQPLPPEKGI